jgi:hypothetical protein
LNCPAIDSDQARDPAGGVEQLEGSVCELPPVAANAVVRSVVAGVGDLAGEAFEKLVPLLARELLEVEGGFYGSTHEEPDRVSGGVGSVGGEALVFGTEAVAVAVAPGSAGDRTQPPSDRHLGEEGVAADKHLDLGQPLPYVTVTEAAGKNSVSQSEDSAFSGTLL